MFKASRQHGGLDNLKKIFCLSFPEASDLMPFPKIFALNISGLKMCLALDLVENLCLPTAAGYIDYTLFLYKKVRFSAEAQTS